MIYEPPPLPAQIEAQPTNAGTGLFPLGTKEREKDALCWEWDASRNLVAELVRRYNAHAKLVKACEFIRDCVRDPRKYRSIDPLELLAVVEDALPEVKPCPPPSMPASAPGPRTS